eukprot:Gb_03254 [translate_table: standard]
MTFQRLSSAVLSRQYLRVVAKYAAKARSGKKCGTVTIRVGNQSGRDPWSVGDTLPLANGVKFVWKNAGMASVMRHVSPRRIRSDLYSFSALDINSAESNNVGSSPCILSVLSSLLERVVVRNERKSASTSQCLLSSKMGIFHGFRVPDISIEQFLERIFKYVHCSPSVFVVAYAYIDRLIQLGFRITSLNVHRLLITSVMLASKFLDDLNYNNAYYAKVGGITTKDINSLEIEFLFMLDFRLQVTVSVFESYCAHLEREVALGGGYQIERTLRCICGMDEGSTQDDSQKQGLSFRCSSRGP